MKEIYSVSVSSPSNIFRKWVLGAGIFNIVAAFPLATPFLYKPYYSVFNYLNHALGLGGMDLEPPVEGINKLLVNTAGLALMLVGLILVYASTNLKEWIGIPFLNAIVRLVFSALLVYYLVTENISRILLSLAGIEVLIAGVFLYYIFKPEKLRLKD